MLPYAVLSAALFLFWIILSGHFTLLFLFFAVVSVSLVIYLLYRMDKVDHEPAYIPLSFRLLKYAFWLMHSVIQSNIDVVKRIWNPKLPISPQWERVPVKLQTARSKTLYANSITLTPGTLTTEIKGDYFLVHSLSKKSLEELKQGEMEKQIQRLEI